MSSKFLPHLSQLRAAAHELPDAELWPNEEYIIELKGSKSSHMITFKKISYLSSSKGKTHRWIYEGKVRVS